VRNSIQSKATSLWNVQGGFQPAPHIRITADIFNLLNASVSDIDYYFTSRLPGEPLSGIDDIHSHPAVPRTLRVSLNVAF
jgi:outer membrane receptor protein involved in Fe transport